MARNGTTPPSDLVTFCKRQTRILDAMTASHPRPAREILLVRSLDFVASGRVLLRDAVDGQLLAATHAAVCPAGAGMWLRGPAR
jgi:hypothetical protein